MKAKKILISPIGTGRYNNKDNRAEGYEECIYKFGEKCYEPICLTAWAISKHFGIDKTYFVGTMKSMWDIVYDVYATEGNQYKDDQCQRLYELQDEANADTELSESVIEAFEGLKDKCEPVLLYYGISQEQIDENSHIMLDLFKRIVQNDGKDDDGNDVTIELHIDITHSFRSLSFFVYNMIGYIQEVMGEGIKITNVHYGMLEFGNELPKETIKGRNYTVVPMLDLNPVYGISQLAKAAGEFKKYGNGYSLAEQLNARDEKSLRKLGEQIKDFSEVISTHNTKVIKAQTGKFAALIEKDEKHLAMEIVKDVLKDFIDKFPPETLDNAAKIQIELADWYRQNKNYGTAFVFLYEALWTHCMLANNLDPNDWDERSKLTTEMQQDALGDFYDEYYKKIRRTRNFGSHYLEKDVENYNTSIRKIEKRIKKAKGIIYGTQ
jgi:CRISPR-associated Csx2 family protein